MNLEQTFEGHTNTNTNAQTHTDRGIGPSRETADKRVHAHPLFLFALHSLHKTHPHGCDPDVLRLIIRSNGLLSVHLLMRRLTFRSRHTLLSVRTAFHAMRTPTQTRAELPDIRFFVKWRERHG